MISSSKYSVDRHHTLVAKTEQASIDTAISRPQTSHPELINNHRDRPDRTERLNPCLASGPTENCVEQIQAALIESPYPLRDVWCHLERSNLILSGSVKRYHHIQVSIKVAERYCGTLHIINKIQVINQIIS